MTRVAEPEAGEARPPRHLDPRGVRVTVVGADAGVTPPVIVEPPPIALVPSEPRTGVGLLGGLVEGPERPLAVDPAAQSVVDGAPTDARLRTLDRDRAVLHDPQGSRHEALLLAADADTHGAAPGVVRREVVIDGWRIEVAIESASRAALQDRARRGREEAGQSGPTQVHAIIPGVVVGVSVAPGDTVTAGQQLLVVEAMKMQNELRSPRDGTIERVGVGVGSTIEVGDLLLVLA